MDLDINSLQTLILVLLILYFTIRSIRSHNNSGSKKRNIKTKVPEIQCGLPIIGHLHLLNDKIPYFRTFSAMAEKYGSIFALRLGCHPTIMVSSAEIAKECLTTKDRVFASRPDTAAGRFLGYDNAVFGLAPYGQYWREIRKIATLELLSSSRLEKLKHIRHREIYTLVKDLFSFCNCHGNSNKLVSVTISDLIEHMTFNINVQMIAGKRFSDEAIKEEDSEGWRLRKAIRDATYLSGVFVVADAIPWLGWFDFQGYVGYMKRTAKELDSILHRWMVEHIEKRGEFENDFLDVIISAFEENDKIYGHKRDTVIKATALMLVLTGSGSTAITLTWALSLLLNHPNAMKAAKEELDTIIGKHKWVQESDIKDLKYLQAIVKETLRLYPPAPLTGIREATEDCYLNGYHISKGTRLFINLWKLHRDPKTWSNPNAFEPERFLNACSGVDFRGQDFEFIPFSSGRRSCPGMTFGMQVVHLTLARLIQGFDMSTKGGAEVDMSEGLGVALPKKHALDIVLKPRLPLELYEGL
ncbi:dimethylnonatriene synthase-like [Arachis stenosperma]|uniref:dimethylnonatriene synthase-like n=1 Tax=Arachis stenosperma TaxID=217475 RepID=UPI0025ACF26C|nr:dimethylnonatriene synthase-like [Arachis stenosperma]